MTRHIPLFVPLAAVLALTALPATAQTLACSDPINPYGSYSVQIGTQTGAAIPLGDRLFSGPAHSAIIDENNRKGSLVIKPRGGFDAEFVEGNEAVCATPGPKPKFYSIFTEAGRRVLDPDQPLSASIKACTYHGFRKCEKTVTIDMPMGLGLRTFTANRGYPPCTVNGRPIGTTKSGPQPHTGTFNIRVYGKLCIRSSSLQHCFQFRQSDSRNINIGINCSDVHRQGYTATFVPGPNCGPPTWPTTQLRDAYMNGDSRYEPYAEWCDFTVTAN